MAERDYLEGNNQMDDDLFGVEDLEGSYDLSENIPYEKTGIDGDNSIQNKKQLEKGSNNYFFPITVYLPDDYDPKTDSILLYQSKLIPGKKVSNLSDLDYITEIKGTGYWNFRFGSGSSSADIYYGTKNKEGKIKFVGVETISGDTKLVFKLSPTAVYNNWKKENLENVKTVKSLKVEFGNQQVLIEKSNLQKRLLSRENEINKEIEKVNEFLKKSPNTQWAIKKKEALEKDLKKSLDEITQFPDSEYVNKDKRTQIIKTVNSINSMKEKITEYDRKWHEYDQQFVGSIELMNILEEIKITPAELKALIGQESGDYTLDVNSGDKAGIGQIGSVETKEVGYKPEERLDPNKAILIAAKVLKKKISYIGIKPSDFDNIKDYKSFIFAGYNRGNQTIKDAMKYAKEMGRNPYKWNDLIRGENNSPLYKSIKDNLTGNTQDEYDQGIDYVNKIFERLGR